LSNVQDQPALAGRRVDPGQAQFGLADPDFKFKWRFVEEDAGGWRARRFDRSNVTIPTASETNGLGDGAWRRRLPYKSARSSATSMSMVKLVSIGR